MSLFGELQKLIEEHGSASILRERLAFWQDRLEALEKEKTQLETKLAFCEAENAKLRLQTTARQEAEEFVEYKGALLKVKTDGKFHEAIFCPKCKLSTSPKGDWPYDFYECVCGWRSTLSRYDVSLYFNQLKKRQSPPASVG